MRRGILLDPRTGRPEELTREQVRDAIDIAPAHILDNLDRARRAGWNGAKADRQLFRTRVGPDAMADLTAAAPGAATETALFASGTWASIPALAARSGQTYKLTVLGVYTTPAAPGTMIVTPRYGTTTGGVTLGPTQTAVAQTASLTNAAFTLEFWFDFRMVNNAVASGSSGVGVGRFQGPGQLVMFGGTVVTTLDTTSAQGIFIGLTISVAACTYTPRAVLLESLD